MSDARIEALKTLLPQCLLPDWVRLGSRLVRLLRDQYHHEKHGAVLDRLLQQARDSVALREQRRLNVPEIDYPSGLPIAARKDEIVAAIRQNQAVIIAGETGSGKTTQLPKMCLEAGLGIEAKIGCTQPRRVAALSISRRIAEELRVSWGREVGCKIRFDDRSSAYTYIKLMTDGILLAETQGDPTLAEYNALIIDEAHERSLNIDFLLGHLKGLLARRKDLRLVVTSATIDTQLFSRHFDNAPVIEVSGRLYPVEVVYQLSDAESEESLQNFSPARLDQLPTPVPLPRRGATHRAADKSSPPGSGARVGWITESGDVNYVEAAVEAAERILRSTGSGDLLIFMPGERDIRETCDQLEESLHGDLPSTKTKNRPPYPSPGGEQRIVQPPTVPLLGGVEVGLSMKNSSEDVEIIPLFGRLSAGDQQRVFAPSWRRKIVVATNIAETSLTIPGIRYVIDTGLARFSRYNPRTRTKRLPVEPISQSSANQRKGRAGRVQDGVCLRLYSEEDFNARPAFTQPEIQRSNLAEVILRMKVFGLGQVETFPFVQPPTAGAIAAGYTLLQELGALDDQHELTPLGRDLGRLPIDPALGRMLLHSQREGATREVLIIAAGLSIQDPRERPLDQKDAATAAHQKFNDPRSDFLALLNIWNAVHDEWETLRTQNQRRKFCRQHFLSYLRMREWQDLHAQLQQALEDARWWNASAPGLRATSSRAERPKAEFDPCQNENSPNQCALPRKACDMSGSAYDAIHRSILAGLIGHVARREDRNSYKSAGNRLVTVFPGSVLYERGEPPQKRSRKHGQEQPKPRSNRPQWIVAGEIVETSQLFARTVAAIDPQWIYQLAPHCCKVTHQNPHWSAAAGRVLVEEIVTWHGLEVQRRKAGYGNINPKDATAIFIRSALVEENLLPTPRSSRREEALDAVDSGQWTVISGQLSVASDRRSVISGQSAQHSPSKSEVRNQKSEMKTRLLTSAAADEEELPPQYRFLARNHAIRQKIENWQTRVRSRDLGDLDQALFDFYARRIENVSSLLELNRLLRGQSDPNFLCITEAELAGGQALTYDVKAFPDAVVVGGQPLALGYAYAPGEEHDGVTVKLPFTLAQTVSSALLEWAVPGLREEKIGQLLRSLPKALRRELMPFPPKVAEIVRDFHPTGSSFLDDLSRFIQQRYAINIPPSAWQTGDLPAHLRPRLEIMGENRKPLGAGRDLDRLRQQLEPVKVEPAKEPSAWQRAAQKWERFALTGWTFGDLPERITIIEGASDAEIGRGSEVGVMPPSLPEGRRGMGRGGAVSSKDSASPLDLKRDPSPQPSPIGGERERSVGGSASTALDLPQYAWPGLQFEDGNVNLRLFHSPDAAREASLPGVRRLVELAIQKDLGWLEKDLRGLSRFEAHYAPIGTGEELRETALEHLRRHLLPTSPLPALTEAHFKLAVDAARRRVPGLALQLVDRVGAILELYQQAFKRIGPVGPSYALRSEDAEVNVGQASSLPFHGTSSLRNSGGGMPPEQADRMSALRFRASSKTLSGLSQLQSKVPAARSHPLAGELAALLPPRFLERISFERLPHFPRYLKALLIRAERAALNPLKDQERSRQLVPYLEALKTLEAQEARSAQSRQLVEEFRWMIEEFKVSLFAQELGTAVTVSPKRLNEQLDRIASSP